MAPRSAGDEAPPLKFPAAIAAPLQTCPTTSVTAFVVFCSSGLIRSLAA